VSKAQQLDVAIAGMKGCEAESRLRVRNHPLASVAHNGLFRIWIFVGRKRDECRGQFSGRIRSGTQGEPQAERDCGRRKKGGSKLRMFRAGTHDEHLRFPHPTTQHNIVWATF
jgi:hypothetical protein